MIIFRKKPMAGVLYLLPNTLGNPDITRSIPRSYSRADAAMLRIYIVENLRNARRYLKSLDRSIDIDQLQFYELNEHTPHEEIPGFLSEVMNGEQMLPSFQRPVYPGWPIRGRCLLQWLTRKVYGLYPLTGPSSVLLSLMASGLNGQSFTFHGYLPVKHPERIKKDQGT